VRALRQSQRQLKSERGMALVMALGVLVVLTILGTTVTYYSVANLHSTSHSTNDQRAFALAEAGLNNAVSVLSKPGNDPSNPNLLPASGSPATQTVDGGTLSYWGSYNSSTGIWTVTGKGSLVNRAGTRPVTRKVSQQWAVSSSQSWKYIYVDNPSGCLSLTASVQITQPLFDRGSLCMSSSAVVTSMASPVTVAGTIQTAASASVGTSSAHLAVLHVGGGCRYGTSGSFLTPCTAAQQVYADSQDSYIDPNVRKAPIDLPLWYANAAPGPSHNCTTGSFPGGFDNDSTMNTSLPSVRLLTASAYDCTVTSGGVTSGRIAWTPGSPGTLTIQGTIFFDGNLVLDGSAKAVYVGRATIYSSGTITFSSTTQFCGKYGSVECDWTNWDPDLNMLVLVAGGSATPDFQVTSSAMFQGGIYAKTDYTQSSTVKVQGPIQAQNVTLSSSGQSGYPGADRVPGGAPGGGEVGQVGGSWSG
jgi:Tfp pilus assembly protein PilX